MRRFLPILAAMLLLCFPLKAQQKEQSDSLVRLLSAKRMEQVEKDGQSYRKVTGPARFLHNDTYLICDTAFWNMNTSIIECINNVSIIQEETRLTSDKLIYLIDDDLAQFRGAVVQLEDKDGNVLRTRHLDYNTKDSVAVFAGGGAMRDKDGQIIESFRGRYDSKEKLFTFTTDVNMFTDSIFVKTTSLDYYANTSTAYFGEKTDAWKEENMLSANSGWYDRGKELFFFRRNVHGMNDTQEAWSDSLYFNRLTSEVELLGHAQVSDTSRNSHSMAGRMLYIDSVATLTMTRNPVVVGITREEKADTVYARADTLIYFTRPMCDITDGQLKVSKKRMEDIDADPVSEYRRKAAEAAAKAAEEAKKNDPNAPPVLNGPKGSLNGGDSGKGLGEAPKGESKGENKGDLKGDDKGDPKGNKGDPKGNDKGDVVEDPKGESGRPEIADTTKLSAIDTTKISSIDTTKVSAIDSTKVSVADSTMVSPADSAKVAGPAPDSTKVGFLRGIRNFKLFKSDLQIICDSLEYTDLDSLIRLYKNPVVWNDAKRQYAADSLFARTRAGNLDKASLMSNAFVVVREDSLCYDQIRSTEMMAYFDSVGVIKRFDALGDADAIFYIQEDSTYATINLSKSKILSALFKEGEIDQVYYFDQAKSDAYPVAQIKDDQRKLKGFNWQPSNRPAGKEDITKFTLRESERKQYASHPKAEFKNTDIYFPGYMQDVYAGIEAARLERERRAREREAQKDSLDMAADSLRFSADSLGIAVDSLGVAVDSLGVAVETPSGTPPKAGADSLKTGSGPVSGSVKPPKAEADTLKTGVDSLKAGADSVSTVHVLTEKERKALEKEEKRKAKEAAALAKIAAKEAEWARLDSLDAVKAAKKAERKAEKERKKKIKILERMRREQARENAVLQKYVNYYRKKKAAEDAKKARQMAKEAAGTIEQLNRKNVNEIPSEDVPDNS